MATRCSNDSGIFRPHFNYSAPSPFGYFDNLFTPSSSSPHQRNRPSNVMSDLQKFDPEAFYRRIFRKTENDSASEILAANECSHLYVLTICENFQYVTMLFRSECYRPPCPSPNFLETLDTSHSTHNIKIIAKFVDHPDSYIPMWKIRYEPWIDLEPGLFVQGRFGQGVILELSHDDKNFQYFICYTFNNGPVFLLLPNRFSRAAQQSRLKYFVFVCRAIWSRIRS
jgi:hypothetical protein